MMVSAINPQVIPQALYPPSLWAAWTEGVQPKLFNGLPC